MPEILSSNDARLQIRNGPVLSPSESPITVTFDTTSPFTSASELQILLEAQGSFVTLQQSVDLFDFQAGVWVTLDSRQCTTADSTVVASAANPARFIQAGTRLTRARVRLKPAGPVLSSVWQSRIDRLTFLITP